MAETGHAKNVANFQQVINIITALGAAYNPSQALILLAALLAKLTEVQNAMAAVNDKEFVETEAVNERVEEFEGIGKLATRIGGAVAVSVNDEAFSKDITTRLRKLQGRRAGDKPVDDPSTPDVDESQSAHSVSQQSYDNLDANFAEVVNMLGSKPEYDVNETDVKTDTLEAKSAAMSAKNNAAKVAIIEAQNARAVRDALLYDDETGVLALVRLIKKYIAYAFGKDSAAYQQINALNFKKN